MNEQQANLADIGTDGLGGKAARGGAVVFGAMAVQKVLALAVMVILARLLTPEDYGLLGMVIAFIVFLQLFSDMGLTVATVQKSEITQAQISTLFWLNLAFSCLLAAVVAAVAPAIVWFYHEPRLLNITLWLAPGFIIAGLGNQHAALLQRQMKFVRLAICDTFSLVASAAVGVWMALKGFGVYALVGQSITQAGTRTVLAWILNGWRPGLPARGCGTRDLLRFGGYFTGFNLVNYFSRNLDNVLLGRVWGAETLGLYTRAYTLMCLPISFVSMPICQVAVPALSKLQNDHTHLREAYRKVFFVVALATFPMMAGLLAASDEVIAVVYGAKWMHCAPIFRILCLAGLWQGIFNTAGHIFLSAGRTDRMFRAGIMIAMALAIFFFIGVWYGPLGMAAGYSAGLMLLLPWYLWYAFSTIGLRPGKAFEDVARGPLVASLIMASAVWFAGKAFSVERGVVALLVIKIAIGISVYVLALAILAPIKTKEFIHWIISRIKGISLKNESTDKGLR